MYMLTIHTKFTFGDLVRFDAPRFASPGQPGSGIGRITGIMIDESRQISYAIDLDPPPAGYEGIMGILESEITLL